MLGILATQRDNASAHRGDSSAQPSSKPCPHQQGKEAQSSFTGPGAQLTASCCLLWLPLPTVPEVPREDPCAHTSPRKGTFHISAGSGPGGGLGTRPRELGLEAAAAPRLGARMVLLEAAGAGGAQAGHRAWGPGAASPGEQRLQQRFPWRAAGYALGRGLKGTPLSELSCSA